MDCYERELLFCSVGACNAPRDLIVLGMQIMIVAKHSPRRRCLPVDINFRRAASVAGRRQLGKEKSTHVR